jgi:hypothetical protein
MKLYDEELHDLYSSSNVIRLIRMRRRRLADCVARMGEKRVMMGKPEGRAKGKSKVVPVDVMKAYRGVDVWLSLDLALDGVEYLKESDYLEVVGVDGRLILK